MPRRAPGVTYRAALAAVQDAHQNLTNIIQAQDDLREQMILLLQILAAVLNRDDGRSQ